MKIPPRVTRAHVRLQPCERSYSILVARPFRGIGRQERIIPARTVVTETELVSHRSMDDLFAHRYEHQKAAIDHLLGRCDS